MKGTAQSRYAELESTREPYLRRARSCSKFTIPSLIPPDGWKGDTDLPEPWNNLGARGVNNLASKLLLTLFPPGSACFRNELDPKTLLEIKKRIQDPKQLAQFLSGVDDAMAEVERRSVTWTESRQHRPTLGQGFKHLIVGGNVLLYLPASGAIRSFSLDKYVVLRDTEDKIVEIIIKECVSRTALPDNVKQLLASQTGAAPTTENVGVDSTTANKDSAAKTLDKFTHIYWDGRHYRVYEQIGATVIPGTDGNYPADKLPWLPLRWTKIDGEDYGYGHVDMFLGDLSTLDMLSQALTEGAAAAARIIYLKQPGTAGRTKDVVEARNGATIAMDHNALKVLQVEKHYDFQTALQRIGEIERSLSFAFLLNTAIQRKGERVTAEEIRYMAQELEDALGGVYSVLSQELQLPYVKRMLFVMGKQKAISPLPNDIVPVIITGLEALGRGNDLSRLDAWMQGVAEMFGPNNLPTYVNVDEYLRRRAVALSVDTKGLIKTPEEIAQAQQAAQQQALIHQLGPQAVSQLGGLAKAHANNQSKEKIAANGNKDAAAGQPAGGAAQG